MSLSAKARRAPLRVVTGAFIVNSGIGKLSADEATAQALHGMATGTYPFLGKITPKLFTRGLAVGELALGGALLAPFVSPVVAGAGLTGFSAALLQMYWKTPGMHQDGDPRPTQAGLPIAKDVWMLGIGASLVIDGVLSPAHDKKTELVGAVQGKRRSTRKAKVAARKARKQATANAVESVRDTQVDISRRAAKTGARAAKAAAKAADRADRVAARAAGRLADLREEYGPLVAAKATQVRDAAAGLREEYGPVVAEKVTRVRDAAQDSAVKAQEAAQDAAAKAHEAAAKAQAAVR